MNTEKTEIELEETDIVINRMVQERNRAEEEKRWRQIALMLHSEMEGIGLPSPEERDYDLGGDEWICSRCGIDTWHRDCGCSGAD